MSPTEIVFSVVTGLLSVLGFVAFYAYRQDLKSLRDALVEEVAARKEAAKAHSEEHVNMAREVADHGEQLARSDERWEHVQRTLEGLKQDMREIAIALRRTGTPYPGIPRIPGTDPRR